MRHILEDYLDTEKNFFDYKTSSVTGKVVFDTRKCCDLPGTYRL